MQEWQKFNLFENTSLVKDLFENLQSEDDYILNKYAPLRISKTKKLNLDYPWLCNHIKNLITKCNRLHTIWLKNKNNVRAKFRFESASSNVENEIKKTSDKLAIANELNDCFSSIGGQLANQIPKLESNQL